MRHLDISNNLIRTLPSALGWLDLEVLELSGNPHLNLPEQVISFHESQLHAIRSYLQIVCEQHRLIDRHLTQFNTKPGQNLPSNFILAGKCDLAFFYYDFQAFADDEPCDLRMS